MLCCVTGSTDRNTILELVTYTCSGVLHPTRNFSTSIGESTFHWDRLAILSAPQLAARMRMANMCYAKRFAV